MPSGEGLLLESLLLVIILWKMNHLVYKRLRFSIVPQLGKCLKFMTFRGGGGLFCIEYSHFYPSRIDLSFRHLSSCDTIVNRASYHE